MAETAETHVVVEIPVDADTSEPNEAQTLITAHPLTEISLSSGHLLLLKLFNHRQSQITHKITLKETQLDNLKREAFYLSSLFLAFHGIFFTLLFTSSLNQVQHKACKNWWVPCCLSVTTSVAVILAVQVKVWGYWNAARGLEEKRREGRGLERIVMELRMKGVGFDLSSEPQAKRRVKCSSGELIGWRLVKENWVGVCLLGFAGIALPLASLCSVIERERACSDLLIFC